MMGKLVSFCTQLLFSNDYESNLSIYGVLTQVEFHVW